MLWISTRFGLCIEVAGKPVPDVLRFILITPKPQYSNIMETQSLSCAPHTITGQNQALLDVSSLIWSFGSLSSVWGTTWRMFVFVSPSLNILIRDTSSKKIFISYCQWRVEWLVSLSVVQHYRLPHNSGNI